MKKSELIRLLSSSTEEEVLLVVDEQEYDIEIEHLPEVFDGFCASTPAAVGLKPKEIQQ